MPCLARRGLEYGPRPPDALTALVGRPKWPLRQILARRVPPALTERTKMGFCPPTRRWLRGPLREWAEAQLAEDRLRREGFFRPRELRRLWNEHLQGKRDRGTVLWA